MEKYLLQQKLKTTSNAYLFWFFLGAHYAYLGQWGKQIAYWLTFGGLGIWTIIDAFRMKSLVEKYNRPILYQISKI